MDTKQSLLFFVNGKKVLVNYPEPETTLLQYLRQTLRLTGSKNACNQGGCGACTVMLSKYDWMENKVRHFTVNACITLLCSVHGHAVTTVEGVGSTRNGLHPIQQCLVRSHGIQCGFCTPGMVMSLYCLWRNTKTAPQKEVERVLEGNLCRCTGYRPIADAMKHFNRCEMAENCCRSNTKEPGYSRRHNREACSSEFIPSDPTQVVIFPPELMIKRTTMTVIKTNKWTWIKPTCLAELVEVKKEHPYAKIIMGGTSLGFHIRSGSVTNGFLIDCSDIPEMSKVDTTADGVLIGAAVTLTRLEEKFNDLSSTLETAEERQLINVFRKCVRNIAADQIRNVATIGGHIATADPLSDLNPLLLAVGTKINILNAGGFIRSIELDEDFFCGAFKTVLSVEDTILSVFLPFPTNGNRIDVFKQSQRNGFSYAIVNAAMSVSLENNTIQSLRLCYGGVGERTHSKCMEAFCGQILDEKSITNIIGSLIEEILECNNTISKYKLTLAASFTYKFLTTVLSENFENEVFQNRPCESIQIFEDVPKDQNADDALGRPIPTLSAKHLVCGEAKFIDDLPRYENELFLALVLSTRAHAKIISVDTSVAMRDLDVVEFIDHKCVMGSNNWGLFTDEEELFATEEVQTFGHIIGGVLAKTRDAATKAAKQVKVNYEDLKSILTIEEAIQENSFFDLDRKPHERGNVEEGFQKSGHVIEGELRTGAQDHMYMEPLSAIAVPKQENGEMEVYVGHQNPTLIQRTVAKFLGVPANRVIIRHKRTGGAFGGKESVTPRVSGLVAVAAARSGRPVRCIFERSQNFHNAGKRNPFLIKYKVGFNDDGKIIAADFNMYSNAGFSLDFTLLIMDNGVRGINNSYNIPNLRVDIHACKTNTTSNTAFRGFGVPQSLVAMETVIEEVAIVVGKSSEEIREMHFYKEGDTNFLDMPLIGCNIKKCWDECRGQSAYEEKKKMVDSFNRSNKWRKRGVAMMPVTFAIGYPNIALNQGSALIHIYLDGSVLLAHGGCEIGQGINIKMMQVASRALGIPIEKIYTGENSTSTVANATGTSASTTSDIIGAAVYDGCMTLNKRLQPFKEKHPDASWEKLVNLAYTSRVSLSVIGFGKPTMNLDGVPFYYFTYGAACSVVEVDCLTGDHKVLSTDIVMDVGKSLNPAIDIGQIEGGFVQGYGMYTMEEIRMNQDGVPVCDGPVNYKIPGIRNIPREFRVSLLKECPNTKAVYSSKGIGEPPFLLAISVFLAIRKAISASRKANGLDENCVLDCPATPERIRLAFGDSLADKCNNLNEKTLITY